ncbi:MAG: hypothetical protein ABTQ31_19020 [Rhizobiaceae bacterium]
MKTRTARRSATAYANLMLAPAVVMMRMPLLAAEAGRSSGGVGAETMRAVSEKAAALAEGAAAAQMSLFGAAMSFWPEVASGRVPALLSGKAAERSLDAALKPIGQRVRANHRRLSKG